MSHDGLNSIGEHGGGDFAGHAGRGESDVSELARRLRMTAQHLAGFLEAQYERLDSAARQCEQLLADRDAVERARTQLQQQTREWEASRAQREEEIRQEQDRLIGAWKDLEGQQRRLLAGGHHGPNGSGVHPAGAVPVPPPTPQPGAPLKPPPRRPALPPPLLETDDAVHVEQEMFRAPAASHQVFVEPATPRPAASKPLSREAALEQFQRLKREIRSHSQRSRQNQID